MTRLTLLCALVALSACAPMRQQMAEFTEPTTQKIRDKAPEGAAPGTCWGRDSTPAVIETVTQQVQTRQAEVGSDGSVIRPAQYETRRIQRIVEDRVEYVFEVPCDLEMTPEFVSSLQRALRARGAYSGLVTGEMDGLTRAAVREFQRPQGLDTGILTLATAQALGLSIVPRSSLE